MIGNLIRTRRRDLSMTQAELAEGICSRTYLSRVERTDRLPSPRVMIKLAERLDLSACDFTDIYLSSDTGIPAKDYLTLARNLAKRGHHTQAQRCVQKSEEEFDPSLDDEYDYMCELERTRGYAAFFRGDYQSAVQSYRKLLQLRQRRPSRKLDLVHAHYLLGDGLIFTGNYEEAKSVLFEGLSCVLFISPEDRESLQRTRILNVSVVQDLMHTLIARRELTLASALFDLISRRWEELKIEPPVSILLAEGIVRMSRGDLKRAESTFSAVIRQTEQPDNLVCAHMNLALIHRLQDRLEGAMAHLRMAWRLHEKHNTYYSRRRIANQICRCHIIRGDLDAAAKWVNVSEDTEDGDAAILVHEEQPLLTADIASSEQPDRALEQLKKLRSAELRPDMEIVAGIVEAKALLQDGRVNETRRLLESLKEKAWSISETR